MKQYDLRDYMLLKSRKPGPRAKHVNLRVITYGTQHGGNAISVGSCISYKFFAQDVEKIADMVHGDAHAHMVIKRQERMERKLKRVRRNERATKIRVHTDSLHGLVSVAKKKYHQERMQ